MADKHIKIKVRRYPQTPPLFEQCAKKKVVIQNQIPSFGVGEERNQRSGLAGAFSEDGEYEFHVRRRELDPAICLNHFHRLDRQQLSFHFRL
jgi:hypothetical protein